MNKKYTICREDGIDLLVQEVNKKIEQEGWKLQGGVSVGVDLRGIPVYLQALYKEL
jgi:hypothetical protein